MAIPVPFSVSNRGAVAQIDNDFPDSARIGLLHILRDLKELGYAHSTSINRELQRIARLEPSDPGRTNDVAIIRNMLSWDQIFDLCERIYTYMIQDVYREDGFSGNRELVTSRSDAQKFFEMEIQTLFLEENLAFEFSGGVVRRKGRRNTANQIARTESILGDPTLATARVHYVKAVKYFRQPKDPDYENAVKEAVCAVEAAACTIFKSEGSTLDEVLRSIKGNDNGKLPHAIVKTIEGLYAFRGGGRGVSHGSADGGAVTKEIGEYVLAAAASQIVLLYDFGATLSDDEPPF